MKLSRILITVLAGAALAACDGAPMADVEATPPNPLATPEITQTATSLNTTPLQFEGEAQFWWEVAFATNPTCDGDILQQEVDLRVKLGKLMGTAPVYPSGGNFDDMQAYHDVLKGAEMKAIFKQSFGFTDADIANY